MLESVSLHHQSTLRLQDGIWVFRVIPNVWSSCFSGFGLRFGRKKQIYLCFGTPNSPEPTPIVSRVCGTADSFGGSAQLLTSSNNFNMPITYTIDHNQKLIMEVWTGEIQAVDLAEYWKRYLGDPDVLAIRRTIADLRQAVILFQWIGYEGYLIKSIVQPILAGRDWKTAIVIEKPSQLGITPAISGLC